MSKKRPTCAAYERWGYCGVCQPHKRDPRVSPPLPDWFGPALMAVGALIFILAPVISAFITYGLGW